MSIDLSIAELQNAPLQLTACSEETVVELGVTEIRIAVDVGALPDLPEALIVMADDSPVDLIEITNPIGGGEAPAPVVFIRRADLVSEDLVYRGAALPGTEEADARWRIERIEISATGEPTFAWAGGAPAFAHAWSDRATLSYESTDENL